MKYLLVYTLSLGILVSGCVTKKKVELIPELAPATAYFKELKHWYRKQRVFDNLDVKFYVEATYMSPPLRLAYMTEYAHTYNLNPNEQRALFQEDVSTAAKENIVMISIFAPERNWDRLDGAGHVWKLRGIYMPSGIEVAPSRIEEVYWDDPKFTYFYPYAEKWSRHYRVRLPVDAEATELRLVMQGVLGRHQFEWPRPK